MQFPRCCEGARCSSPTTSEQANTTQAVDPASYGGDEMAPSVLGSDLVGQHLPEQSSELQALNQLHSSRMPSSLFSSLMTDAIGTAHLAAHSPAMSSALPFSEGLGGFPQFTDSFYLPFSDPTGSLSHIELGTFGESLSVSEAPGVSAAPLPSYSAASQHKETLGVKPLPAGSACSGETSADASHAAVVHPEVGDVLGDGSISHEAIISHFKEYAKMVGFGMTRNFDNLDSSGHYRRVRISCKQAGLPRKTARHDNPALQRERTSQKVGCPFEVTVWRTKQRVGGTPQQREHWVVTNVKGLSHGPCPLLGGSCHPMSKVHDGIHKDVQDEIKAQLRRQAGQPVPRPLESRGASPSVLQRFLSQWCSAAGEAPELSSLLAEIASSGKKISEALATSGIHGGLPASTSDPREHVAAANAALQSAVMSTGQVRLYSGSNSSSGCEYQAVSERGQFVVAADPLNGVKAFDSGLPCGTIFGVYRLDQHAARAGKGLGALPLTPGRQQVAAGYILYSAVTVVVLTLGDGVHGFTLDHRSGEFVLSHRGIRMPERGNSYAVNELGYGEWPAGLRSYIQAVARGDGQTKNPYAARSTSSLVADFHKTLLHGGLLLSPGRHVRLVHEASPLSLVMEQVRAGRGEGLGLPGRAVSIPAAPLRCPHCCGIMAVQAGGSARDCSCPLLDLEPARIHDNTAAFLGSRDDMAELQMHMLQDSGLTHH
mmetsp:Transcript_37105/g.88210  ORF Transcript_37105/g.88210 Transcript_37105/m.88210 type:complete len:713 (+) Transcript_37105:592-2730(+)